LGIQAFEPVLIEGKAIQLHPLVCAAFNADFDGDQMAVHVPLSIEAQLEARVLMMSTNNILSPANGKPIIVPSQDIVLGLYDLTLMVPDEPGEGMAFANVGEIHHALEAKAITLHSRIKFRYVGIDEDGDPLATTVETTPGRAMLSELLPRRKGVAFDLINRVVTKKEIGEVIDVVYRHCGQKDTVIFCDRIMSMGFTYACRAGISFGKDDMVIPASKGELVRQTQDQVKEFEQQYLDGVITQGEKYNKVIDAWSRCTDRVAEEMMKGLSSMDAVDPRTKRRRPLNPIFMMAHSGARGSPAQIKQLAGMRGLMAKPSGEIIETPIISNFKEGLTVLEYFNSTHGARKGLADTALKTANSGYLTRRLVDVAQDCTVVENDCGTDAGLDTRAVVEGGEVLVALGERVLGRTASVDIVAPETGRVVVAAGTLIDELAVLDMVEANVEQVRIRSVLTCQSEGGVCAKCYGRDLARGTTVNIGESIGVIAAQSIGEPGTQLTMRTFHIGGTAQRKLEQSSIEATADGVVTVQSTRLIRDSKGQFVVMNRNWDLVVVDGKGAERARYRKLPYGARLLVEPNAKVKKGTRLAEWDPYNDPIVADVDGIASLEDLIDGISVREIADEASGVTNRAVIDWRTQARGGDLRPRISLRDSKNHVVQVRKGMDAAYPLPVNTILAIDTGAVVKAGDVIARIPRESGKTRDITGGLPRVAELFEARRPKDAALIAEIEGRVTFGKDYKAKRRVTIEPKDESADPVEYLIPKGKAILVHEGDVVQQGDAIMDGNPVPHDILRVLGVEALATYLVNEIQEVYRLQGVRINDKHIEVICRQMLQKVEIATPGDTTYLVGEQVDRREFDAVNAEVEGEGRSPATSLPVLQGITKASLQTKSFISAASFQETTRVLTEAAVAGKVDRLEGLKENVIVGRLIPAGTGGIVARMKAIAAERDRVVLAGRAAAAEAAAEVPTPSRARSA
ncbi:MAG: DNA-directed RNA polymerase subunit beta', partial [Alphaproteobacteria bacterium]